VQRLDGLQYLIGGVRRCARQQRAAHAKCELGLGHAHAVADEGDFAAGCNDEAREDAAGQRPADIDVALACQAGRGDFPADDGKAAGRRQLRLDGMALHEVGRPHCLGQRIDDAALARAAPEQACGVERGVGPHANQLLMRAASASRLMP
jgi:hypothetical protein